MSRVSGCLIHCSFGSIKRAADFGEIGLRRSWLGSGDKQSPWLFESLLLRRCQTRGRFRRNRPTIKSP